MKKLLAVFVLCLMVTPAFAGIGFHLNLDMTPIPGETTRFAFDGEDINTTYANMNRGDSGQLIGGGIDITFGMIPVIDLMLSIEGAYSTYSSYYETYVAGVQATESPEQEYPYLRAGVDLTALYTIVPIPALGGVYIGAGPSFMAVAPVFSEQLVMDNFSSASDEVDPTSLVDDIQMEFGFHLALGAKLKPVGFPLAFRVGAKYYIIPSLEEPAPSNWLTLQAGVVFGF